MAAPILPSLFPRPPLGPPHQQLCFPPAASMAPWDLPPPPVQFFGPVPCVPGNNFMQPPPIIGAVNFVPGPGFRGRGYGHHQQRGFRGRGRGGTRRGGGQGAQGSHIENKVQKPPEFSCKVCNKDYRSEESYQIHLQSHQKCSSCDFEAVPRILKEHELLHFLPDELKLTSPEDIKKWREDRRKNYPTAENIARKKKNDEEKKARGEVAKTPLYRYIKRILGDEDGRRLFNKRGRWGRERGSSRGRERGRGGYHHHPHQQEGHQWRNRRGRRHSNRGGRNRNSVTTERDSVSAKSNESSTKSEEKRLSASDEVDPTEYELENDLNDSVMNAIMADVAASSAVTGPSNSQCSDDRLELKIKKEDSNDQVSSDSGLVPEHQEREKGGEKPQSSNVCKAGGSRKRKEMEGGRNKWGSRREAKPKRKKLAMGLGAVRLSKPTLLEKLLAPEIRREQNAILQCIHHIIDQDFFGLNSQPS